MAQLYDAIYYFKDYAAECKHLSIFIEQYNSDSKTLLDVACGTGKHLEHLQENYQVEGLDITEELLEIARQRCPRVPFYKGDMVDFNLNRTFDVVTCLFSAIAFVRTVENLHKAVASMALHLNPGGILFMEPFFGPENYWAGRLTANFVDQPDLKIAWMYISEIEGRVGILDNHFLVGRPEGITYFTERHEVGLFTPEEYQDAFRRVGLDVEYDSKGLWGRGMYIGKNHETP